MFYNWEDYQLNSATESVALLLSERSQQLVLAALQSLDSRDAWLDTGDLVWDDIDAAIAEAYEEVMEVQSAVVNQQQFGVYLRSVDQNLAGNTFTPIAFTNVAAPQFSDDNSWMIQPACTSFILPSQGYYKLSATVQFGALATANNRIIRFDIDGVNAAQMVVSVAGNPALSLSNIFHIGASATVQVHAYSQVASLIDNTFPTRFSIVRLYDGDY